ncbi:putative RNA-binding protein [Trypanosoma theileri]|uniref:Putative RNA-binding protein n=1 Tax=Trypanosoma theileri TaxID=67003 RepID=A0A1X0P0T6_9TRYP|nr:putative RNA-binding protein [Trypanosoma theileri]ORC90515.1 putative RNA-binding protein [Trypanosoma theileri]
MMNPSTMLAFCPSGEFARIESSVREWPGVEAVGSLRTKEKKKNTTTVFVKFDSEESARKARSLVDTVPGLSLSDDESSTKEKNTTKIPSRGKAKNLAMELLNFGTYDKSKGSYEQPRRRGNENYQRNRGARGGRGQQNTRQNTGSRGGRRQHFYVPPARVSVVFADNIPFNMTNLQLMELFSPFGHVIDINRYELIAMISFDSPESVSRCIQELNGKTVKGNVISVSSGTVKIPGPAALQMGM